MVTIADLKRMSKLTQNLIDTEKDLDKASKDFDALRAIQAIQQDVIILNTRTDGVDFHGLKNSIVNLSVSVNKLNKTIDRTAHKPGGCVAMGELRSNLKWLYIIGTLACCALFFVIGYFHLT